MDDITTNNDDLNNGDSGNSDSSSTQETSFSIPEEYASKGWAKTFEGKTGNDLMNAFFKSYDNAQGLVSKRVDEYIENIDLSKLDSYENIKSVLQSKSANVPENIEDYKLESVFSSEDENSENFEVPKDVLDKFANSFKEIGLNVNQAQELLKMYSEFELENFSKLADPEELKKDISTLFNNDDAKKKNVESLLNEFLTEDDANFLKTSAPNKTILMFYKLAKGLTDKYDFTEGNASAGAKSSSVRTEEEKNAEYNKVYNKLMELQTRPHSTEEKEELLNELRNIYK